MTASKPPVALVLAAGFAQRFGTDKRFVRLSSGRFMIDEVLERIHSAGLQAVVALRTDDPQRHSHTWSVPLLPVEEAERGMGASLAAAVRQLPGDQPILVCLADMPFIRPATYAAVAAALTGDAIAIPVHNGRRGHPVAFAARYQAQLRGLDGERGARDILERERDRIIEVEVDDPGIHRDIDTVADLLRHA